jgi:hypothetical protein
MVEYDDKVKMRMNRERVQAKIALRQLALRAFSVMRARHGKRDPWEGIMKRGFWGMAERRHSGFFSAPESLPILVVSYRLHRVLNAWVWIRRS